MIAAVGAGITIRLTGKEDFDGLAKSRVNAVLAKWKDFEKYAKARRTNMDYFSDEGDDFDNYYKGRTMNEDIQRYFG
jgi:hypothetical protein